MPESIAELPENNQPSRNGSEARDPKALHEKARAGQLKGFTGIDAPYEAPDDPEIAVQTDEQTAAESVDRILAELLPRLRLSNA